MMHSIRKLPPVQNFSIHLSLDKLLQSLDQFQTWGADEMISKTYSQATMPLLPNKQTNKNYPKTKWQIRQAESLQTPWQ